MINRYQNTKVTKTEKEGNEIYVNSVYPDIPYSNSDVYVITTLGDRLDIFANNIYGDTNLWWIIAAANKLHNGKFSLPDGTVLRIPANYLNIVNNFIQ